MSFFKCWYKYELALQSFHTFKKDNVKFIAFFQHLAPKMFLALDNFVVKIFFARINYLFKLETLVPFDCYDLLFYCDCWKNMISISNPLIINFLFCSLIS